MSLHPIAVVDQVLTEYRSYLLTEFRARDEKLRRALDEALDGPRFLAQDPFFQVHRPFKEGRPWRELSLDARLAQVMEARTRKRTSFLHQSEGITRLLGPSPGPLVVTTGTGSGKTECFLLPVIQNAIEDSVRFGQRSGLTAILVYPMNALANDQEERIGTYLRESGHTHVRVARYDRSTDETERAELRRRPPHILLTNYMMLEYLLVRPADRTALFQDHRCRFLVLDEVHSYRGSLGANIALLLRRLQAHLREAEQTFATEEPPGSRRFPALIPVATSATIKSIDEADLPPEQIRAKRDEAVQDFLAKLTGFPGENFMVISEEIAELTVPPEAGWPSAPVAIDAPDYRDADAVRRALAQLAGATPETPLAEAAQRAGVLWKLHELLTQKPLSIEGIVESILDRVPERRGADRAAVRREVEAALVVGAALPDGTPGALRLRTHRFLRGGWRFHRCVDPVCGKVYAKGEEQCACGKRTAPLYLCRSCGASTLRFRCDGEVEGAALVPNDDRSSEGEWLLYDRSALDEEPTEGEDPDDGDEDRGRRDRIVDLVGTDKQMKRRPVKNGTFDPETCSFTAGDAYPIPVTLAPARNRCLCCGATTAAGSMLTPVGLGTSAAVRVVAEGLVEGLASQHSGRPGFDGKERLLIFADSRQDAAHQARFITYAGRYDRMRRRVVEILRQKGELPLTQLVQELMVRGVEHHDNKPAQDYKTDPDFLPKEVKEKALAWEEAPLLDDLAVSAVYRATLLNLGLCGVHYEHLSRYIERYGSPLRDALGLRSDVALEYLLRLLLDEVRVRRALSRPLLSYHPMNKSFPIPLYAADWERRVTSPTGYPCDESGRPLLHMDRTEVPEGITLNNCWRAASTGGRGPGLERRLRNLLKRLGGAEASPDKMHLVLEFLCGGPKLLVANKLYGYGQARALLQVNADCVTLRLLQAKDRFRCSVCNTRIPWAFDGAPCPTCHGSLGRWPESDVMDSRYAQRILHPDALPLVAGEHTAQVTSKQRLKLESEFKAPPTESPVNVLACSPTLEMGIDVGGLDAVVMRNVPPRPDNYAQRGGRAGRRSRVGVVLGYARNTPHDGYFYDKPEEMIAGAVPAPGVGLGNRDIVLRHLHALAFGGAEPGLSGRMGDYVTIQGELVTERVDALIASVSAQFDRAARLALTAWSSEILKPAELDTYEALRAALEQLPPRMRELFDRVRFQILQLHEAVERWSSQGVGQRSALYAQELKRKLLGLPSEERNRARDEADDRSSGNPMRRFAEFGVLPGYEFPSEPCTLRLLGDEHAEEPIAVERRFGIAQYQPDGRAHARGHRWRVIGLDPASPWNPKSEDPSWVYSRCKDCGLCYKAQTGKCPRCSSTATLGFDIPGYEYAGFLAVRDDTPVLEEEDRYAISALVRCHPQWNGYPVWRYRLPTDWDAELRREEEVRWVNEWKPPTRNDIEMRLALPGGGRGFLVCPSCGKVLTVPDNEKPTKGRTRARKSASDRDPYGHAPSCTRSGQRPQPLAITTSVKASTLRLVVPLPLDLEDAEYQRWGHSLGYALRIGLRHLYMLDGSEVEFELEPAWEVSTEHGVHKRGVLTFIDPSVGGSGFLDRAATELHLVAARALDHLDHADCESACYRCLKSYQNQRVHSYLSWPRIMNDLEALRSQAPEQLPVRPGDLGSPAAWLDAYAEGVGSPLELRFLRLFEQHGLTVHKQTAISLRPGEPPISTADFTVPGVKVAIYIDGVAFHQGERLRRDRKLRARLREAGWHVLEWTVRDLDRGAALIRDVRQ